MSSPCCRCEFSGDDLVVLMEIQHLNSQLVRPRVYLAPHCLACIKESTLSTFESGDSADRNVPEMPTVRTREERA